MKDWISKKIADYLIRPFLNSYLKRKSHFRYKNFKFIVFPGVFHPRFFFSTRLLLDFIQTLPLQGKSLCEPGAGAGTLSLFAASLGAKVTAFDINPVSIQNIQANLKELSTQIPSQNVALYTSDLFDQIPPQYFDFILINPPYFFRNPENDEQKAWYCGSDGAYFHKLFQQIPNFTHTHTQTYMILADNCEIQRIEEIAAKYGISLSLFFEKKVWWERNYVFKLLITY